MIVLDLLLMYYRDPDPRSVGPREVGAVKEGLAGGWEGVGNGLVSHDFTQTKTVKARLLLNFRAVLLNKRQ